MTYIAYSYTNKKNLTYYLHKKQVTLRGGNRLQTIYFFSKQPGEGAIDDVPEGFHVVENEKTGLPVLRRDENKK